MPELPDLEVFKDNIYKRLTSKRLVGLKVFSHKVPTPQSVLEEELVSRDLQSINRHGKELFFDFADGHIITVHLMLNGKISVTNESTDKIWSKVLTLTFENENIIFYDTGNIGTVIKYKPSIGKTPDALGDDFTLDYFKKIIDKNQIANIKAFLIDQKIVKGIGNAYADEILWFARVSPKSIVGKIPDNVMVELYNAIGTVLRSAVNSIKSISPDIISGEERSFLKVHSRFKKATDTGFPIMVETIASKKTYFTKEQIVY